MSTTRAFGLIVLFVGVPLLSGATPAAASEASSSAASPGPLAALRAWEAVPRSARPDLGDQPWADGPLTKDEAVEARRLLLVDHAADICATRRAEWNAETIVAGGHTLKWKRRQFGAKPKDGWNLFLSLHGGGNVAAAVNDEQWENQIKLYQPSDSLYIAPRAPTDTWNLWHESHVDALLDRLLEDAFILGDVNPNRVYLMGYSAGGDGVYQLAPRTADRWAAAAMMAGHPNDAEPLGLRNLPFTIHVGALDDGFDRNKVAAQWGVKLDALREADPAGYTHLVELHAGRGHWMNLEDKSAVDWMARFTRNPLPDKVVWKQSSTPHDSFYWLAVPPDEARAGQWVVATRKGQHVEIEKAEGVKSLTVRLSDAMLDLNRPVSVTAGGKELFNGVVPRTIRRLRSSLAERGDPFLMFDGSVTVRLERATSN